MNFLPLAALVLSVVPPPSDIPSTKPRTCGDKCAFVQKMMEDQCKAQKPAFQGPCKDNAKSMKDVCEKSCKGDKIDKNYIKNHFRPKPPDVHDQSLKDQKAPDDGSQQMPPDSKKGNGNDGNQ